MRLPTAAIAFLMLLAMAVPVAAQQVPLHEPQPDPQSRFVTATPTPSPQQLAKSDSGENDGVTSVARTAYAQLTGATLDRSRLTPDLSQAWTPQLEKTASSELSSFGTPGWSFVGKTFSQAGTVSVYRLAYPNRSLYLTIGVTDNGVIYALRLSDAV